MKNLKNLLLLLLLLTACTNKVEKKPFPAPPSSLPKQLETPKSKSVVSNSSEIGLKGIGCIEFLRIVVDFDYVDVKYEDLKEFEIDLYTAIGAVPSHSFWQKKIASSSEMHYFLKAKNGQEEDLNFRKNGFFWHGIKQYSLQFYSRKEDHLEIKLNDKIFWVKEEDLRKNGLKATTWKQYFKNDRSDNVVLYNLNLRAKADKSAAKITLIKLNDSDKGNIHQLDFTGNFNGNWAEIKLKNWKEKSSFCNSEDAFEHFTGWIKYLDDTGFPNVLDRQTICLPE